MWVLLGWGDFVKLSGMLCTLQSYPSGQSEEIQAILSRRSRAIRYITSPPLSILARYVAVPGVTRHCQFCTLILFSPCQRSVRLSFVGALFGLLTDDLLEEVTMRTSTKTYLLSALKERATTYISTSSRFRCV